jgi:hypothetical protein
MHRTPALIASAAISVLAVTSCGSSPPTVTANGTLAVYDNPPAAYRCRRPTRTSRTAAR